jgi:hypothetical protein
MRVSNAGRFVFCVALAMGFAQAAAVAARAQAAPAEILIGDAKSSPESMAVVGGTVYAVCVQAEGWFDGGREVY